METMNGWASVLCDSLEKVRHDVTPSPLDDRVPLVAYRGQTVSVQLAVWAPAVPGLDVLSTTDVRVDAPAGVRVTASAVDLVPVQHPAPSDADDGFLDHAPGLYPDLLRPVGGPSAGGVEVPFDAQAGQWRALWIDLQVPEEAEAVTGTVEVSVVAEGSLVGSHAVGLRIAAVALPPLSIHNTHWFHCDGLAQYYGDEVFGEDHWRAIDAFLGAAAEIRANTILTPAWTPPIDTAEGMDRLSTQLVDITLADGGYTFDFTKLRRWLGICRRHGFTTIELPHLFTQWGAYFTPAIHVMTDEGPQKRFGWHVAATDPSYRQFLEVFLPELRRFLDAEWAGDVVFHVSDEPGPGQRPSYAAAREVVADLLEGCTVADALSDVEFLDDGLVQLPIVATDHAEPFLERGREFWLYYCVVQYRRVANRFIAMPSSRNRVIGTQLFLERAAGFLHWGFNFYNSQFSRRPVNPFLDTCAGGGFVGGDSFLVYPGPGRVPLHSIRSRVFAEAMDDHRAMQLLASLADEDLVRDVVQPDGPITLTEYPLDASHYRRVAARLFEEITARL